MSESDIELMMASKESRGETAADRIKKGVKEALEDTTLPKNERYKIAAELMEAAKQTGLDDDEIRKAAGLDEKSDPRKKAHHLNEYTKEIHTLLKSKDKAKKDQAEKMLMLFDNLQQNHITVEEIWDTYHTVSIEYKLGQIADKLAKHQRIDPEEDRQVKDFIEVAKEKGLSQEVLDTLFTRVASEYGLQKKSLLERSKPVKEKATNYIKRKADKVKEFWGNLHKKDLDSLLDEDFREELKDTPPFTEAEVKIWGKDGVFDPDEVDAIALGFTNTRSADTQEKIRDMITRQQKGLACCKTAICRIIEAQTNGSINIIDNIVKKYKGAYAFTDEQLYELYNLWGLAQGEHVRAVEFCSNNRIGLTPEARVAEAFTGIPMNGKEHISAQPGPYGLEIKVDLQTAQEIFYKKGRHKGELLPAAFITESNDDPPLTGIIQIQGREESDDMQQMRESAILKIKRREETQSWRRDQKRFDILNRLTNLHFGPAEEKREHIYRELQSVQTFCLEAVSLDVLEHQVDESQTTDTTKIVGEFKESDTLMKSVTGWGESQQDGAIKTAVKEVLGEDFQKIVEAGNKAFEKLMAEGGFSRQEALAYVMNTNIDRWPREVDNVLKAQKARKAR